MKTTIDLCRIELKETQTFDCHDMKCLGSVSFLWTSPGFVCRSQCLLCLCVTVLADNLKSNPGIKWQYFSSEEGIFTVFPAHKFHCKGSYEHRSRSAPARPAVSFLLCCNSASSLVAMSDV